MSGVAAPSGGEGRYQPPGAALRADQVADAFLQQYLMEPRVADIVKEKNDWSFHYAVGPDVVNLYADPAGHAERGNQTRAIGFGEVLRSDTSEVKAEVAASLARYICYELKPKAPLLLLPPIAQQINRVVHAIGSKVDGTSGTPPPSRQAVIERLLSHQDDDLEIVRQSFLLAGPIAEMKRIRMLFEEGRLQHLAAAGDEKQFDVVFRRAFQPFTGRDDGRGLSDLTIEWYNGLQGIGGRSDRQNTLEVAEAMAMLELINKRLAAIGTQPRRLLYITGDTSVFRFASTRRTEVSGEQTFAEAFLRHPRAYLDDPGALRAAGDDIGSTEQTLADTLTLWLGHFRDFHQPFMVVRASRVMLSQEVTDAIHKLVRDDPGGGAEAERQWAKLAERAVKQLPPNYADQLVRAAAGGRREELKRAIAELRPRIEKEFSEAFDDFFQAIVMARMALNFPGAPPAREHPSLCFEKVGGSVSEFFREADRRWSERESFPVSDFKKYRDSINKEYEHDPKDAKYFTNLVNAWLLACQGHWKSAIILARRSIFHGREYTYVTGTLNPVEPNGREARYLLAICLRYAAENRDDLAEIDGLLDEVERIAKIESLSPENADWPPDIVPERFAAERLVTRVTRLMFEYFASPNVSEETLEAFRRVADEISDDLVALIKQNLEETQEHDLLCRRRGWAVPSDMPPLAYRNEIRDQILRGARRQLISIQLLTRTSLEDAEQAWRDLRGDDLERQPRAVWRQEQAGSGCRDISRSGFGEFQDMCCMAAFGSTANGRAKAMDELYRLHRALAEFREKRPVADFDLTRLCVHPFDPQRFMLWIETASSQYQPLLSST